MHLLSDQGECCHAGHEQHEIVELHGVNTSLHLGTATLLLTALREYALSSASDLASTNSRRRLGRLD